MNLTAKTGFVSPSGMAFFILGILSNVIHDFLGSKVYDAYAPLPIVLDIMRKGRSRGRGSI